MMYIFNLDVPLVLCNLQEIMRKFISYINQVERFVASLFNAQKFDTLAVIYPYYFHGTATFLETFVECLLPIPTPERIGKCIAQPDSDFMMKHGECVIGTLTDAEKETSESMLKTWTNFAIHG